jgi:hypothetical protein
VRWINSGKLGNYYTGAFRLYHLRIGANDTDKSALDLVCLCSPHTSAYFLINRCTPIVHRVDSCKGPLRTTLLAFILFLFFLLASAFPQLSLPHPCFPPPHIAPFPPPPPLPCPLLAHSHPSRCPPHYSPTRAGPPRFPPPHGVGRHPGHRRPQQRGRRRAGLRGPDGPRLHPPHSRHRRRRRSLLPTRDRPHAHHHRRAGPRSGPGTGGLTASCYRQVFTPQTVDDWSGYPDGQLHNRFHMDPRLVRVSSIIDFTWILDWSVLRDLRPVPQACQVLRVLSRHCLMATVTTVLLSVTFVPIMRLWIMSLHFHIPVADSSLTVKA